MSRRPTSRLAKWYRKHGGGKEPRRVKLRELAKQRTPHRVSTDSLLKTWLHPRVRGDAAGSSALRRRNDGTGDQQRAGQDDHNIPKSRAPPVQRHRVDVNRSVHRPCRSCSLPTQLSPQSSAMHDTSHAHTRVLLRLVLSKHQCLEVVKPVIDHPGVVLWVFLPLTAELGTPAQLCPVPNTCSLRLSIIVLGPASPARSCQ